MLDVFTFVYLKTFNMLKTVTILLAFFSSFLGEGDLFTENFLMLFLTAFLPQVFCFLLYTFCIAC